MKKIISLGTTISTGIFLSSTIVLGGSSHALNVNIENPTRDKQTNRVILAKKDDTPVKFPTPYPHSNMPYYDTKTKKIKPLPRNNPNSSGNEAGSQGGVGTPRNSDRRRTK